MPPDGYTLDPSTGLYIGPDGSTWDPSTGQVSGSPGGRTGSIGAVIPGSSQGPGINQFQTPLASTGPTTTGGNIAPVGSLLADWSGQNPANFNPQWNQTTSYVPSTPTTPNLPVFNAPPVPQIPAFQLPTADQAAQNPGYQFSLNQGLGALQNSATARGLATSGGTAKDLVNYAEAAGTTNYQNVLNNLLNQYQTNVQTQYVDPYQMAYQNAVGTLGPQMTGYTTQNANNMQGYATQAAAGQYQNQANFQNSLALNNQLFNQYMNQKQFNYGAIAPVLTAG